MGLLDRLKPAPLLRSGPLLLLPSGTSPDVVDALVAQWAPLRRRKGEAWKLAEGLRWIGPIEVTMADVTEFELPGGFPIAYVAQAKRSRGDGITDRLMDKAISRSYDKLEKTVVDDAVARGLTTRDEFERETAEEEARRAVEYPQGEPEDAERDGWKLVCGLARRLRGTCRLVDGRFFLPSLYQPDGEATLYARTLLDADEVATLLAPVLGDLAPGDPGLPALKVFGFRVKDESEWQLARGEGPDEVSITANVWERDLELRSPFEPLAVFDTTGGRTVEYDLMGPDGSQADILLACALLAAKTEAVVLDDEGFVVNLPAV